MHLVHWCGLARFSTPRSYRPPRSAMARVGVATPPVPARSTARLVDCGEPHSSTTPHMGLGGERRGNEKRPRVHRPQCSCRLRRCRLRRCAVPPRLRIRSVECGIR